MQRAMLIRWCSRVAALAFASVYLALAIPAANATSHLSGTWTVIYSLSCNVSLTQDGSDVAGTVTCGSEALTSIEGEFDAATGSFSLSGSVEDLLILIDGTLSSDGQTMAGTLSAPPLAQDGEFSGVRSSQPDPNNIAGSWLINVRDVLAGPCTVDLEQTESLVAGSLECAGGPTGRFEGVFESDTQQLSLLGPFGDIGAIEMRVSLADDGNAFNGVWQLVPDGLGGIMEGERISAPEPTPQEPAAATPEQGATPSITLPAVGLSGEGRGVGTWVPTLIAVALALSAASYALVRGRS